MEEYRRKWRLERKVGLGGWGVGGEGKLEQDRMNGLCLCQRHAQEEEGLAYDSGLSAPEVYMHMYMHTVSCFLLSTEAAIAMFYLALVNYVCTYEDRNVGNRIQVLKCRVEKCSVRLNGTGAARTVQFCCKTEIQMTARAVQQDLS